jgi:GTP-binding protein
MPEQYRRYLVNSLRESFDLPGVPIRLTAKSGKNPYAEGETKGGPVGYVKPKGKTTAKPETKAFGGEASVKRVAAKAGLHKSGAPKKSALNRAGGPKAGSTKSVGMKSAGKARGATKGGRRPSTRGN